ncbi:MAG: SAM-dependent methyltransferase [Candidatus Thorarchaeota archaeon]
MPNDSKSHKNDFFYKQAKKEKYRARSAYKLIDLQNKFNLFKRAFYILDLGSAPGSWLQISKKFAEENLKKYSDQFYHRDHYKIMGVDTKKLAPIDNVVIVNNDFTTSLFQGQIEDYFRDKLDLILSDASIKKTGNKFSDHIKQIQLCNKVLLIIKDNLKHKGNAVIKVFQGSDFDRFAKEMKSIFRFVKPYKPKSSKKKSNETFLVGLQKV